MNTCRYCNGKMIIQSDENGNHYIECEDCLATGPKRITSTMAQLIFLNELVIDQLKFPADLNLKPAEISVEIGEKKAAPEQTEKDIEIGRTEQDEIVFLSGYRVGIPYVACDIEIPFRLEKYALFNLCMEKLKFRRAESWALLPVLGEFPGGAEVKFYNGQLRPFRLREAEGENNEHYVDIFNMQELNYELEKYCAR